MKTLMRFWYSVFLIILTSSSVYADKTGRASTTVSFGGYQVTSGTDSITGSQLAITYMSHFSDQWAYFGRLGNASASGHHINNGNSIGIKADTTTLSGGVQWTKDISFGAGRSTALMPYLGGGLSLQKYSYDFSYEGSEIGKTSGLGYGPLFRMGVKFNLSDHFVVIPGYHYEIVYIESENGDGKSITSSGMVLALVARF